MRNDMMKVVAEPARGGRPSRKPKGEKVRLQREGIDSVQRQAMSPGRQVDWDDRRRFHLSPLHRFLRKQVGRCWDDVYSEICRHAPSGTYLGNDLRERVNDEVHTRVSFDGDEMYGRRGWKVYEGDLYVCPQSGLLKVKGDGQRKRYRWRPKSEYEMLAVDGSHKFVKVDGLWFFVTLSPVPGAEVSERPFDLVLKEAVFAIDPKAHPYHNRILRTWGGPFYASGKRQANSREIRRIEAALAAGAKVFSSRSRARNEGCNVHRQPVCVRR